MRGFGKITFAKRVYHHSKKLEVTLMSFLGCVYCIMSNRKVHTSKKTQTFLFDQCTHPRKPIKVTPNFTVMINSFYKSDLSKPSHSSNGNNSVEFSSFTKYSTKMRIDSCSTCLASTFFRKPSIKNSSCSAFRNG